MNEIERDLFDPMDCNWEGDIYNDESLFHLEMELLPWPPIDNFYNHIF